uniref:NAD kinase n=1 Tax=candidate division WOR-3 bacterium TaxID=2052148 RepID=A0A7C4XG74_UNCW3
MIKVKVIINKKKKDAKKNLFLLEDILQKKGFEISENPDFIIALGGDGTFLTASFLYGRKGIPILGVNSGGLGFLTDVHFSDVERVLEEIKKNKFHIEERMVVKGHYENTIFYALNDLTICTRIPGRVVEFSATINNEYLCRFVADGIIVATPTGSTAYSLATGGPILLPHTESIILTPISPHTLSVRPMVLPGTTKIEIQTGEKGSGVLVADGQRSRLIKRGGRVLFQKADYTVRLLKPEGTTFFNTLREKMKWGGREDA